MNLIITTIVLAVAIASTYETLLTVLENTVYWHKTGKNKPKKISDFIVSVLMYVSWPVFYYLINH